ncbi:hypothetical protein [Histidinibacterium lentulum]|uniref:hypothetical protein n=1 Tax=Histidinibacterium lentulum TaxID=2480588 RepID=UPI001C84C3AD|nr:hypothetical protein [Histidinibacterium lentulum]
MDIEVMLEQNGHRVIGSATSVPAALRLLDTLTPDVAVLDVNLRGQSVAPVAERLREISVPFVLASAYDFRNIDSSDVLKGAVNIGKPIRERRLLDALTAVIAAG